jgi:4-carboxymuconolactone decarboxylase
MNMPAEPTPAQKIIGDFSPKLVSLTDEVLFGDIWERPSLSKRDRSLVTVATLVALYRTDQMASHMKRAIDNGLTVEELVEVITHIAFYAGWPNAMTAITMAKNLFEDNAEEGKPS